MLILFLLRVCAVCVPYQPWPNQKSAIPRSRTYRSGRVPKLEYG